MRLIRVLLPFVFVAACGGLDPIVSPDATVDAEALDGTAQDALSIDASANDVVATDGAVPFDGSDAAAPFTCGKIVCDAKTHYCERKTVGDSGVVDTCIAYPTSCGDDGGKANCACIAEPCTCTQSGDEITVTCP